MERKEEKIWRKKTVLKMHKVICTFMVVWGGMGGIGTHAYRKKNENIGSLAERRRKKI